MLPQFRPEWKENVHKILEVRTAKKCNPSERVILS